MRNVWIIFGFLIPMVLSSQVPPKGRLLAGPMNGYSEHREVLIWLQTKCVKKITLKYFKTSAPKEIKEISQFIKGNECEVVNTSMIIALLDPGSEYEYNVWLDDKEIKLDYPCHFRTKDLFEYRHNPPSFSFLVGSCLYINDSLWDRPGEKYGQGSGILQHMASSKADLMFWLGDNTYLREADYSSQNGILYRYNHTRRQRDLQKLLANVQNIAIWDDHDYGPNNSDKTFDLKNISRSIFTDFWGNKTYGQNGEGIYSRYQWSDCEYFLLDNRTFRDNQFLNDSLYPQKTQLGAYQLDWLKQSLLSSKATFKFIVMGGQFLNMNTGQESYTYYKSEYNKLLNFIVENRIDGVVFLSGDRHHTEIIKYEIPSSDSNSLVQKNNIEPKKKEKKKKANSKNNPEEVPEEPEVRKNPIIYEITSSPLSTKGSNVNSTLEANNPLRIKQTLYAAPNYCQIYVKGSPGNRHLLVKCFNAKGELQWEFTIRQEDISWHDNPK